MTGCDCVLSVKSSCVLKDREDSSDVKISQFKGAYSSPKSITNGYLFSNWGPGTFFKNKPLQKL